MRWFFGAAGRTHALTAQEQSRELDEQTRAAGRQTAMVLARLGYAVEVCEDWTDNEPRPYQAWMRVWLVESDARVLVTATSVMLEGAVEEALRADVGEAVNIATGLVPAPSLWEV
jgi:Tfp pilus assembly protein FimT